MTRIALINPPSPVGMVANREGASGMGVVEPIREGNFFYPPHTLAWAAAAARAEGHEVRIIDAVAEGLTTEEALARLQAEVPAVIGVQVSPATGGCDAAFLAEVATAIPGARRIALGMGTTWVETDLTAVADLVIVGEPEGALHAAVVALGESAGPLGALRPDELGAANYRRSGHLISLDVLPHPAWDLLPLERYGMFTVYAGRGCEYGCRYCPYVVVQGHSFRGRTPEAVADEMQWLHEHHGAKRIVFRDPLFAADHAQIMALCEIVKRRGLAKRVGWECETRPEALFEPLLRAMKAAGCTTIKLGVETVDPKALVAAERVRPVAAGAYVAHAGRVVALCREVGLTCRVFVMGGLPGEADEGQATAAWLESTAPDAVHVKKLVHFPGTELFPSACCDEACSRLGTVPVAAPPSRAAHMLGRLRQAFRRFGG